MSESNGLLLLAGALPIAASFMNAAMRVDPAMDPDSAIQVACDFFAKRQRRFSFVTRTRWDAALNARLEQAGFKLDADSPCMLIEAPTRVPTVPSAARVEYLSEQRHVHDVLSISAAAYADLGLTAAHATAAFSHPSGLFNEQVGGVIAYLDNQPAAMALTIWSPVGTELSAGIYWVGTVPTARGQGLGELCTSLATNLGFDRGASMVTLQASSFGEPIYRRMGFREYDRQRRYRQLKK